jgi:hypothetical protein
LKEEKTNLRCIDCEHTTPWMVFMSASITRVPLPSRPTCFWR